MDGFLGPLPPIGAILGIAGAALAGGVSRGFSGFGAALVFVPLASAAVGPQVAVPVLALMECVACLVFVPNAWRHAARAEVAAMSAGAICAVPLGALILAASDPVALRWVMTGLVFVAVAVLASGVRYRGAGSLPLTLGVGAAGGLMSGTAMLGGVPPAVFWLGRNAPAVVVRANMNLYFAVLTMAVTTAFLWRGLVGGQTVWFALAAAPAYAVGLRAGALLFRRASDSGFRVAGIVLILVAGVLGMPLWDGLTGR